LASGDTGEFSRDNPKRSQTLSHIRGERERERRKNNLLI
jgi:hypothetical protein